MKYWYSLIGAYLIMHITVMTTYTQPPTEHSETVKWLFVLQWFMPTLLLGLLVPRVQRVLKPAANVRVWTVIGFAITATCVVLYFTNLLGQWFAWPTLGLLVLLVVTIANSQTGLGSVNAWLLGAMVTLMAMGSWEIIYQTGLWFYHDFFGWELENYTTIIAEQFTWIIPALIVILTLYQRGLQLNRNWLTVVCLGISAACTVLWFAEGMDVPLVFWRVPSGQEVVVNLEANSTMIAVSRGSQGFWLLGIASLFTPKKGGIAR